MTRFLICMQILASALPGFRDLRAPLTAGYMWLLFAYLLVRPDLGSRPTNKIGAAVFDLASEVGRIWVALGVGTAAYLVGAVSVGIGGFLYSRLTLPLVAFREVKAQGYKPRENYVVAYLRLFFGRLIKLYELSGGLADDDDRGGDRPEYLQRANRDVVAQFDRLPALPRLAAEEAERVFKTAMTELDREPDLPATVLVEDKPTLFAEVDRLRSESDLRLAVALPLMGLGLLLSVLSSAWWLLSLMGVAALALQGHARRRESRQLIIDAIQQRRIESPALRRLTDWVDQRLDAWNAPIPRP